MKFFRPHLTEKKISWVSKIPIVLVGALTFCISPHRVPDDLEIILTSVANQPSTAGHSMTISRQPGDGRFLWSYASGNAAKTVILPDTVVKQIVREIRNARVFRLSNQYADFNVLDGETRMLTIRMNAREKIIRMRNTTPDELLKLLKTIWEAGNHE